MRVMVVVVLFRSMDGCDDTDLAIASSVPFSVNAYEFRHRRAMIGMVVIVVAVVLGFGFGGEGYPTHDSGKRSGGRRCGTEEQEDGGIVW